VGENKEFAIYTEYITLGQLIKAIGLIGMGGEIREFLYENEVKINGELDKRRGRKIRVGDVVVVKGDSYNIIERAR
jgi:ribosome-associated protein